MNLAENEVIDSPQNSALMKLDGSENFVHPLNPSKLAEKSLKPEAKILHEMMHIPESEKILHYEYIVIKPVGIGAAIGSSQTTSTFNKGHIVNAGILYILESGMMKIISTTGALLLEKNIAFDINENGEMGGENEIVSIVTSPNPEDMHFVLLT